MKAKTRKTVGILFITLPIVGFLSVMILWPVIAGLVVSFGATETIIRLTPMVNLINVILGVLGLVSMIMIPVGFVIGLVLLLKNDKTVAVEPIVENESQLPDMLEATTENIVNDGEIGIKIQ